jgi:hypothetical protein
MRASKIKPRKYAVFKTNFPDEAIWLESGDLSRGPGLKTATVLVEMFIQNGVKVSKPCERDYYGWEFHVAKGIMFVVQYGGQETIDGEESLLLLSDTSFLQRLFNSKRLEQLHRDVLGKINSFLNQDGRFRDIRWFTEEEYRWGASTDSYLGHPEP